MELNITFSSVFQRKFKKEKPNEQLSLKEALEHFKRNPAHPGLNFEPIINQQGFYSIRVDRKIRIKFYVHMNEAGEFDHVEAVDFGTHDIVYRKPR